MARDPNKSKAAYTLVDLSELPAETRQEVLEDALAGGGDFGIRVVEEVVNGAARAQLFGYYHADQEKWDAAKSELGIASDEVDDTEVSGTSDATTDPRAEAALRLAAQQKVSADADAIRTAEDEAVRAVLEGDGGAAVPANTQARAEPNANIVDATANVTATKHSRGPKGK